MPRSPFKSLFDGVAERLDRRYGWDRLPRPLAIVTLIGLRSILRRAATSTTPAAGRSTGPTFTPTSAT